MLHSLQACRALAAALVVLFHLGGSFAQDRYFGFKALDGPFAWGDAGVDFFFVLSGFLITAAHRRDFGQPGSLPGYLWKRLLRIYPTYWVICAAVGLAALALPSLRGALPSGLPSWLLALALLPQDPAVVGGTGSPILFVAWSLQYEMLFYAVMALVILRRSIGTVLALLLLAVSAACQFGSGCSFPLSFVGTPMIFLFAMGVGAALVAGNRLRIAAPLALAVVGGLAFVGLGLLEVAYGRDLLPFDRRWAYGAFAALAIVGLARAEASGALVVRKRWPDLLGDASYALYLLHIPVISVLMKLTLALRVSNPLLLVLAYLLMFGCCQWLAVLFHLHVEKPMLRWFRRRLGSATLRSEPVAVTGGGMLR